VIVPPRGAVMRLIVVVGQEGVGKSTVVRSLLPYVPNGAVLDGEDVGQVNPWVFDEAFRELHRRNVAAVAANFWAAGYRTVVAGSFLRSLDEYLAFRPLIPADVEVTVVRLVARKDVRDRRRAERAKHTSQEWRDIVDRVDLEDTTLARADAGYRYVALDTSDLDVAPTVARIRTEVLDVDGVA
jgi:ABC-type cobalamin/Fe3+-siderophores transport system ATPase subunit